MDGSIRSLPRPPRAVLFDRDGTLVVDVPYNRDPDRVRPMAGAGQLLARLRAAGVRTGIVSNQSGVGRGLISPSELKAVTDRVERLLGPFDVVLACTHIPEVECRNRKPAPGMILDACRLLEVDPADTVVVGDIGSDVQAALRAGAHGILVPTPLTRRAEINAAPHVARSLEEVGDLLCPAGQLHPAAAGGA
ncbi:D-glycero-alpha-D-manno-heptose-1,7-bisphosphate 7-phosphatase [Raineyella fluvialis]|uniref:D,D-heptose 1,7-bisphosphate phosphatase n=1 Tax=Raineyella fluvialis TaxID=2662261 RepID=A0A5Q2FHI6_9ACTN|nr:HAD-IIIA family hydrolase [Raineyella fluvialis]QGF24593.1 HAD-IIIA family hydrolase [Raineyella fluvialis]